MKDGAPNFTASFTRRRALGIFAAVGFGTLAACANDDDDDGEASSSSTSSTAASTAPSTTTTASTPADSATTTSASASATATVATATPTDFLDFPEETNGPFPADGSNDNGEGQLADVLADPRIVRSDITTNLDGSDPQPGIPLALTMLIGSGGAPLPGAAVYAWHCSRDGHYSVYSGGMNGGDYSDTTWFRGVQVADANGEVTFNTIFPGRYQGRAVHIHFEVYEDDTFSNLLLTSQVGFDDAESDAIYATEPDYATSLSNPTYNADDNVFNDGDGSQIVDLGEPAAALEASVAVGI
jgi:protocatechuate 3,4-dioxygenase beta subunit